MMESPIIQLEEPPLVRPPGRLPRGCVIVLWTAALLIVFLVVGWYELNTRIENFGSSNARNAVRMVINAISQFEADYGQLPLPKNRIKSPDWDTDTSIAEGFISVLKGCDTGQNTKGTDYVGEFKDAKHVGNALIDGLLHDEDDGIALYDPWGHYYHIRLDGDGDGSVADPEKPGERLKQRVIIWSAGKDGDPDTWNDNVISWHE
jgi:hypothetical protein